MIKSVKIKRVFIVEYEDCTVEIPQEMISDTPLTERQYLYAIMWNIKKDDIIKSLDDSNRLNG